jgi:hypothetical protein
MLTPKHKNHRYPTLANSFQENSKKLTKVGNSPQPW